MMFDHILIPTDGSDLSLEAVQKGMALGKAVGAKVTAMTVQPLLTDFVVEGVTITVSEADRVQMRTEFDHRLDAARKLATEMGVALETVHVESREPWRAIIETADRIGADLIVMASHGRRGVVRLVLGSVAQRVVSRAPCSVLLVR